MELVPLEKYIKKNDINDDKVAYYFYARCSSLFVYTAELMKSPKMKDMKKKFELIANIYYLKMSKIVTSDENNDSSKAKLKKSLIPFINFYTQLGNKNFIIEGEYLTDFHFDDTKSCNDFAKKEFR